MRKIFKNLGLLSLLIGSTFDIYGQSYPLGGCALGANAGCYGTNNTFIGNLAAQFGAWGSQNVFVGVQAGENNGPAGSAGQQGCFNTFLGWQAGRNNTVGLNNTFIGSQAGLANTTGFQNFYLGFTSGSQITNGIGNVMIGDQTGTSITGPNATRNVFIGRRAGFGAGSTITDNPGGNICIGNNTGSILRNGQGNVFIGDEAANQVAINTVNCISIGNLSDITGGNTNAVAIGSGAGTNCNNCMSLGNGLLSANRQFRVGIGTNNPTGNFEVADMSTTTGSTDIRFPDLPTTVPGTALNNFVVWDNSSTPQGRLYVRTFTPLSATCTTAGTIPLWNSTGQLDCSIIKQASQNDCSGTPTNAVAINGAPISCATPTGGSPTNMVFAVYGNSWASGGNWTVSDRKFKKEIIPLNNSLEKIKALEAVSYVYKSEEFKEYNFNSAKTLGFIAQDVSKIVPEATAQLEDGSYIMNYSAIIPVLTGAIKEQQAQIEELKVKVAQMENVLSSCCSSFENRLADGTNTTDVAVLEQNNPNPFNQRSTINYYVPTTAKNAAISIYTNTGVEVKAFKNLSNGKGVVQIESGILAAGAFIYNLVIDGKQVDTKWMIVTK